MKPRVNLPPADEPDEEDWCSVTIKKGVHRFVIVYHRRNANSAAKALCKWAANDDLILNYDDVQMAVEYMEK